MALTNIVKLIALILLTLNVGAEDDLEDFEFLPKDDQEMMIAQESRQYQTIVKPPVRIVKPSGVTNSHRPQYNLDSLELDLAQEETKGFVELTTKKSLIKNYKSSTKLRSRESMLREAVLRALERKEQVGKLAQVLPIIRAMSESQRSALAALVASQVSTPPGRAPLNLVQVRSMFGNANSTSELMLPILLDMANLIRRAVRSGKEPREVKQPLTLPQAQMLRRSFVEDEDTFLDDELFDTGYTTTEQSTTIKASTQPTQKLNVRRSIPIRSSQIKSTQTNQIPNDKVSVKDHNRTFANPTLESVKYRTTVILQGNTRENSDNITTEHNVDDNKATMKASLPATTESSTSVTTLYQSNTSRNASDVGILDLTADSTNQSLARDLPVAEKLRALNRFIDRKGNFIRRGTYPPKPTASRRTTVDPTLNPISKRRPPPARTLPVPTAGDQTKCELFTNSLCLHDGDYPTEAILQSIRRNKAAAGALLADFRNPGDGTVDGVTADQEAKYTAEHYLVSNRRGDTASRDFASAGEAGFMCPSSVKYARPQRARATSGQWKYIVNTGEHTQTLRLEKCLKPKEPCTYLTDNFKSKCVQVYNYHRLLTWDQQNGLHMDIFKVPTCCSCHIEGYSVSFPPLGHRIHETSSEQFPEDVSAEHGNHAFEAVQSSVQRPSVTSPFAHNKPIDTFSPFSDVHNLISGIPFSSPKFADNEELNSENVPPSSPMDSYGNTYFPDSFNQASSIRNVKRPPTMRNPVTAQNLDSLPSYLEPPTPSASSSFSFIKETQNKYKVGNHFKRGAVRPNRRPIRKKIAGGPDDLISSGTSAVGALETMEDFSEDPEVSDGVSNSNGNRLKSSTKAPKLYSGTTEKPSIIHNFHKENTLINNSSNSKKINYNYHPIIDFFEDGDKEIEDDSIDREDSFSTYVPTSETDWKPINHPTRNRHVSSTVGRLRT